MKTSQAWKIIAVAFLKKAAGDELTERELDMTTDGLCHARWALSCEITAAQRNAMTDDIDAAVDARKVAENEENLAYIAEGTSPAASDLRGTLALLFSVENALNERRFARSLAWSQSDWVTR